MAEYCDLIGKPFEYGARGPEKYDCWGLVKELLNRDGIYPPDYKKMNEKAAIAATMANAAFCLYRKLETPRPGAIVLLRVGRHNCHVGYVLPYQKFIHTWEKTGGVTVESLEMWKRRIAGYFEYVGTNR